MVTRTRITSRIYHEPHTKQFHFVPHGCDQLFEEFDQTIYRPQLGILGRATLQTASGKQRYRKTMAWLLDHVWDQVVLQKRIAEAYAIVHPIVHQQIGKQAVNPEEFEDRVTHLLRFIAARDLAVRSQLDPRPANGSWREHPEHHEGHIPSILYHSFDW